MDIKGLPPSGLPSARDQVMTGGGYASVSQSIMAFLPLMMVVSNGSIRHRGGTVAKVRIALELDKTVFGNTSK